MVEVGIAHYRSRLYVYSFTHKPVLDHLKGLQYSDYQGSSPPAVIARHLEYPTDDGVALCRSRSCIRILLYNPISPLERRFSL